MKKSITFTASGTEMAIAIIIGVVGLLTTMYGAAMGMAIVAQFVRALL